MSEQINQRLKKLEAEYEAGQRMLADMDARRASLVSAMLRIEGAISVLKEMSEAPANEVPDAARVVRPD